MALPIVKMANHQKIVDLLHWFGRWLEDLRVDAERQPMVWVVHHVRLRKFYECHVILDDATYNQKNEFTSICKAIAISHPPELGFYKHGLVNCGHCCVGRPRSSDAESHAKPRLCPTTDSKSKYLLKQGSIEVNDE